MVYHIHRSNRIARASQSETSRLILILEAPRTRLEMGSAERHLDERNPADNLAVGFR